MVDIHSDPLAIPFSSFKFCGTGVRRKQPLSSVMPVNEGFEYAAILTDGYLNFKGREFQVQSFGELCLVMGEPSSKSAITKARQSGIITEGKKFLFTEMMDVISPSNNLLVYLRVTKDNKQYLGRIAKEVLITDIIASQAVTMGEFEVCDSRGAWYLRFRDDDPVIFLACASETIQRLTRKFPENVVEVSADFIYSM